MNLIKWCFVTYIGDVQFFSLKCFEFKILMSSSIKGLLLLVAKCYHLKLWCIVVIVKSCDISGIFNVCSTNEIVLGRAYVLPATWWPIFFFHFQLRNGKFLFENFAFWFPCCTVHSVQCIMHTAALFHVHSSIFIASEI